MSCTHYEGGLTICQPNSWKVFHRKSAGVKWCFKCRRHLPHDWIIEGEGGYSYYEPTGRYDCSGCHQEHVLFPGRVWDWQL